MRRGSRARAPAAAPTARSRSSRRAPAASRGRPRAPRPGGPSGRARASAARGAARAAGARRRAPRARRTSGRVPAERELGVDRAPRARRAAAPRAARQRRVANDSYARSASGGPRQRSSASRSSAAAAPRRRAPRARSASAVSRSKRARSSRSSRDAEQVAGRPRLDRVGRAERPPQLRDLPLHLRHGRHRRPAGVEVVGEPLDRHDAVRVQQQDRERRALPRPAEPDRAVVADHLERSQHAELEHARGR